MKALLDTHTLIWWANNDPSLSALAKGVIGDPANEIFLSSVSTWEMAIKIAIGKLTLSLPLDQFVVSQIAQYQFKQLRVNYEHTYHVGTLPQHHKDPFDRLLIAQAFVENLTVVTVDNKFAAYGVATVW